MKKRNERGGMHPIKDLDNLAAIMNYYLDEEPNFRNYTMIKIGLNTALRISDIICRKWEDFFDKSWNIKTHVTIQEKKTGKLKSVKLNIVLKKVLCDYRNKVFEDETPQLCNYMFPGRFSGHIRRCQAYRIVKRAAVETGNEEYISCHSLRKTFGYHAAKAGVSQSLLMELYNHTSYKVTKRYLCLDQEDRDEVYDMMMF